MAEARPNIAIAPIRIDARIIVFALPRCLPPLSGRCSDDKRPNALSPTAIGVTTSTIAFSPLLERRAQAEGRCAVFDRVRGSGGAPRPHGRGWKIVGTAPVATILRRKLRAPKASASGRRVGRDGQFTNTQFCERAIRRSKQLYFIATMACAEDDGLNVFGCSRLAAGIGFLRLPASSTSGPDVSS